MNDTDSPDAVARAFDAQRPYLVSVAYRMLGSTADAEDAVQEAWLRLVRQDADSINNLAAWLTTVVGRVCLDTMRSRTSRKEGPFEELPELVVTADDDSGTPEDGAVLADSVGLGLLVVLDALAPAERLAFVLHDMFGVPFREIAPIVGKSADAAKMLASRARRKVHGAPQPIGDTRQQRAVIDAFLSAARHGDFEGLLRVLDPEVVLRVDTPASGEVVALGATVVAARAKMFSQEAATTRPVLVNGVPGIVSFRVDATPLSVMAFTVVDGRIVEITSLIDPARLAAMNLPY